MANETKPDVPKETEVPETPETPAKPKAKAKAKSFPCCNGCNNSQPCRNQMHRQDKVAACAIMHGLTVVS